MADDTGQDVITRFTYDSNGNVVEIETTRHDTSRVDRTGFAYDDRSNRIRKTIDYRDDGILDQIETSEYDSHDRITRWESALGDGTVRRYEIYENTYNAENRLISRVTREWDMASSNPREIVYHDTYDDQENVIEIKKDTTGDGIAEFTTYYTYNENNQQTSTAEENIP